MADNKVENSEVAEEVCTKEKPAEQKKVEEVVEDEKEEKDAEEKTENGDAKEENGKDVDAEDDKKEDTAEVTVCKRKSTGGDAANGVEGTPEKKQKLEEAQSEDKETTEVAA